MRVCHVTSVHSRYDIRICEKECVSLVNAGYDTYLVVNDEEIDEEYKGIHIISTGVVDTARVQRILKAPGRVLKKALDVDAEIYHLHDPELLRISDKLMKAGKKVIYDAHEDTEKQIETKYWIPILFRKVIGKVYAAYSHGKFRRMSGLISVTPSIVNKLKQYNSNTVLITNYPIAVEINNNSNNASDDRQEKYIFFAGGISEQWCHEMIAKAVERVEGVRYRFAGREYNGYVKKINLAGTKVDYLGLLSHAEVMEHYKNSIAGMAVLKSNTQVGNEGTLGNTKLFEVMESGRPVICSDLYLWKEIVEKYHCGICVDSENVSSIESAIRYLYNHPEEGNKMGKNGRNAVEKEFNWSTQEKVLLLLYKQIAELT